LLNAAVNLEVTKVLADRPADADARLKFLESLPPTFSSQEVSRLRNYKWVSSAAEKKFNEALASSHGE